MKMAVHTTLIRGGLRILILFSFLFINTKNVVAQNNSVAREWNNILLEAIRNDYARPTVHARNLYHHSIISYDIWATYETSSKTFFLGDTLHGYICNFNGVDLPLEIDSAKHEAISFASFRFILARYQNSPDFPITYNLCLDYMNDHGYDISNTSTNYENNGPAELGNYIAEQILLYGLGDGANESGEYANLYYNTVNPSLVMYQPGNPSILDPNRWQALTLQSGIDQSGNPVPSTLPHLSPEWGDVQPFALLNSMSNSITRDGETYNVYFDTVQPALLDLNDSSAWDSFYKWNHSLVSVWQSHLDPSDGVMWDISPASIGNNTSYPTNPTEYSSFYDLVNGGDPSTGYAINPITGMPYTPQIVPRADYARVLAEFWADGIDSETPPGHWFEIYHYVTDQPGFERKWQGVGPVLDSLEFDVKSQLALAGTMHDAAIGAWSLKGYYDYIRPVSAIRYMASKGQSSDSLAVSYHPNGIPLLPGFIEVVDSNDVLAGTLYEHVGKIKLYTWRGHEYITDPLVEFAGVGWILAEKWWPYQRPTFVTPPFAGFVSGHSTFSRAAAGIMEYITGSPYFPNGMGEFHAEQNEFLQFEEGPSQQITLQWATYKDASDQCSLSRIWGGIHPPIDDIPGRNIGEFIGNTSFSKADSLYDIILPTIISSSISDTIINTFDFGNYVTLDLSFNTAMDTTVSPVLNLNPIALSQVMNLQNISWIDSFNIQITFLVDINELEQYTTELLFSNFTTGTGLVLNDFHFRDYFLVDTKSPEITAINTSVNVATDHETGTGVIFQSVFSEKCDTTITPNLSFNAINYLNPSFQLNSTLSEWENDSIYSFHFDFIDFDELVENIDLDIFTMTDFYENPLTPSTEVENLLIDTKNPLLIDFQVIDTLINIDDVSLSPQISATLEFNEEMDTNSIPSINFYHNNSLYPGITNNSFALNWLSQTQLEAEFLLWPESNDLIGIDMLCLNFKDTVGNVLSDSIKINALWSDLKRPDVISSISNKEYISDSLIGSNNYFIDINFNESMDTTITPLIQHNAGVNLSGSIQYNIPASYYIDSFNYRAYFQILDENIEVDEIDLNINYAEDFAGNSQNELDTLSFIWIDTKNPLVEGIYANDYIISSPQDNLDLVVLFDEEMLETSDVLVDFSPIVTPSLVELQYSWLNSTNLSIDYQLSGPATQYSVHSIQLSNGLDLAGNLLESASVNDFLTLETFIGIDELGNINNTILYPSALTRGEKLSLKNSLEYINDEIILNIFDASGKFIEEILFTKNGTEYHSTPINLESGLYYIHKNQSTFKFVVL